MSDPYLLFSNDNAETWIVLPDTFDFYVDAVHIDEVGNLYVASFNDMNNYRSTDNGETWSRSTTDIQGA